MEHQLQSLVEVGSYLRSTEWTLLYLNLLSEILCGLKVVLHLHDPLQNDVNVLIQQLSIEFNMLIRAVEGSLVRSLLGGIEVMMFDEALDTKQLFSLRVINSSWLI